MMGDEARDVDVELTVLATSPSDSAVATAHHVLIGESRDEAALLALSRVSDVITFDHELVDLEQLRHLEARGVVFRPSPSALRYSVDKAVQRAEFAAAQFPIPRCHIVETTLDLPALQEWLTRLGGPTVVKAARGGYDGRGVLFPSSHADALRSVAELLGTGPVVVEERVDLLGEVAQLVVRSVDDDVVTYPLVTTVQDEGMCAEVRFPASVDTAVDVLARDLATTIARHIGLVGVMAVEYFITPRGPLVNELALRPHNSGHWTIEGTATSQFANHLRAVSGQTLGPARATGDAAVMVNVVGASQPGSLDAARTVPDVHVHDYGKAWRPGRKLGHVTAVGSDPADLHVRAWQSARAYGTSTREV
jgi:5-(carboxyamino)imidazole ribonucleotide synthase